MQTAKEIVTPPVGFVGIVGQIIVFKAVDPVIVVEIDPEEELGPVDIVAQEGFVIVGNDIGRRRGVILVKNGNKVIVLVPTRIDRPVLRRAKADPVGKAGLVVIVVDEFVKVTLRIVVLDLADASGQKGRRRIGGFDRIGLAYKAHY